MYLCIFLFSHQCNRENGSYFQCKQVSNKRRKTHWHLSLSSYNIISTRFAEPGNYPQKILIIWALKPWEFKVGLKLFLPKIPKTNDCWIWVKKKKWFTRRWLISWWESCGRSFLLWSHFKLPQSHLVTMEHWSNL